jgi:hypothetical protein
VSKVVNEADIAATAAATKRRCVDAVKAVVTALEEGRIDFVGAVEQCQGYAEEGGLDWSGLIEPTLKEAEEDRARKVRPEPRLVRLGGQAVAEPMRRRKPDKPKLVEGEAKGAGEAPLKNPGVQPSVEGVVAEVEPRAEEASSLAVPGEEYDREAPAKPRARAKPQGDDWAGVVVPAGANEIDALTYVPGAVGRITDWIWAGSRRPNRLMSFATALGIVGTLGGRRVEGPTQNATHLYMMIVGESGVGKDAPQSMTEDLMRSVGAAALLGPQTFASAPGFLISLVKQPLQLLLMDEIGDAWKLIGAQGQNAFVSAIFGELKKAYNSFKIVRTSAAVGRESVEIICPAVTITGASTPEKFWYGLTPAEFEDGFVNRLLILPSMGKRPKERLVTREAQMVPKALLAEVKRLCPPTGLLDKPTSPMAGVRSIVLGWGVGAAEVYLEYSAKIDELEGKGGGEFILALRGAENAVRIATIIAWGRGSAVVEVEDVRCGIALAELSIKTAVEGKDKFVKAYFEFPEMCDELARVYEEEGQISDRDLDRRFGRKQRWAGILDKAKKQLEREGRIRAANCSATQNSPGFEWVGEE